MPIRPHRVLQVCARPDRYRGEHSRFQVAFAAQAGIARQRHRIAPNFAAFRHRRANTKGYCFQDLMLFQMPRALRSAFPGPAAIYRAETMPGRFPQSALSPAEKVVQRNPTDSQQAHTYLCHITRPGGFFLSPALRHTLPLHPNGGFAPSGRSRD